MVPGGKFVGKFLHAAPVGNETSDEVVVTGTDGGFTLVALGVKDLTGTLVLQVRVLDGEWVARQVTNVTDGTTAASITADGVYTAVVAGMAALRTDLTGSGVTVKATIVA